MPAPEFSCHFLQLFSHTTKSIRLMPMSQSTVRKSAITTLRVLPLLALLAAVVREAKTRKPLRPAEIFLRLPTTHLPAQASYRFRPSASPAFHSVGYRSLLFTTFS